MGAEPLAAEVERLRRRNAELEAALRAIQDAVGQQVQLHLRGLRRYADPDEALSRVMRNAENRKAPARKRRG